MSTIRVVVPPNSGLHTIGSEVFQHDPNVLAEIRFTAITVDNQWGSIPAKSLGAVRIDHIVSDTQGRRFAFTSFVPPYFFWEQMYIADQVGTSRELTGSLLDDAQQTILIENQCFYFDMRASRALRCFGFRIAGNPLPSDKVFPIYEKHISPTMDVIAVELKSVLGGTIVSFIVEFWRWGVFESTDGTEYGNRDSDKLCYQLPSTKLLWRHFCEPVVESPGSPGSYVSYDNISPLKPIVFERWEEQAVGQ